MFWNDFPAISRDLERVRSVILDSISEPGGRMTEGLTALLTRDAKLLRPAFTILSARIQNGGRAVDAKVIRLAAAIEMLHVASLIHDDIIDDSDSRRGGPAVHVRYGARQAVLMGDFLFTRCFTVVAEYASPQNARLLSSAVSRIVSAEIDESNGRHDSTSLRSYLRRIVGKTAVLFALSFHVGSSESGGDTAVTEILRRIGYNIGVGFQIVDDILDLHGNPATTGKPAGTDLRLGLHTLPVILALRRLNGGEGTFGIPLPGMDTGTSRLMGLLRRAKKGTPDAVAAVRDAVTDSGGLDDARSHAARYSRRAFTEIDRLTPGEDQRILHDATARLLARSA